MIKKIHKDDLKLFQGELKKHILLKAPFKLELKMETKNQGYKWFRINAQAQWNSKNKVEKIVGTLIDIDRDYKYQQIIEDKKARLEAIYENALIGIVLTDTKGEIVDVSKGVEKLLGYKRKEIIGTHFTKITAKDESTSDLLLFNSFKKGQTNPTQVDRKYIHKNNTLTWFETNISSISILDEDFNLCVMIDINKRKNAEEKMTALNGELSRFVYLASHDLKEPLRTITSVTERFKDKYDKKIDAKAIQYIDFIETASNRMQSLTAELLTYSELGNKIEKFLSINLNKAINQVIKIDLQVIINENKASITIDKLPNIKGDATQIKLLFQNLISNGIKYRKKTAPKITISYLDKGDHWQFSVKDNGIGIMTDDQEKIFEVFRRLHGKNEYEGSGIGLANCKRIVENHNGEIWVRSTLRRGSTFFFTIPKRVKRKK